MNESLVESNDRTSNVIYCLVLKIILENFPTLIFYSNDLEREATNYVQKAKSQRTKLKAVSAVKSNGCF